MRSSMRSRGLAVSLLVAACFAGCGSVPDIRFVPDDAGATDGQAGGDARADARTDGGGGADASVGSCKAPSPAAATCCGSVWCLGDCNSMNCDDCAKKGCAADEICCGKTGNVLCKARCP